MSEAGDHVSEGRTAVSTKGESQANSRWNGKCEWPEVRERKQINQPDLCHCGKPAVPFIPLLIS